MPQTAKQQAAFMLWAAAGMAGVLIVLYALFPNQQNAYLAEYYRGQIEKGTEAEALDAVQHVAELKDHGLPVLVDALSSTYKPVVAEARQDLFLEMGRWDLLPAKTAAANYGNLVTLLVEQSPHFHAAAHSAAFDLATRISTTKILDEQPNKPQILAACMKVMEAAGKADPTSRGTNGELFANARTPGNANPSNSIVTNKFGASIGQAADGLSGPHGRGNTHNSTFAGNGSNNTESNSTASNSIASNSAWQDRQPAASGGLQRSAWESGNNATNGTTKNTMAAPRDVFANSANPGGDIVRMAQLPGGGLPVATNLEPREPAAPFSPLASDSQPRKDAASQPSSSPSNPFLNINGGPNTSPAVTNTTGAVANGNAANGGIVQTPSNAGPNNTNVPPWPPATQGANSAAMVSNTPPLTPLKAQPVSLSETPSSVMRANGAAGQTPGTSTPGDATELMKSLQSAQPGVAQNAAAELARRGYSPQQIDLAKKLYDPNPAVRIELAQTAVKTPGVDGKPWLLSLSQDQDPNVRFAAAGIMATTTDPDLLRRVDELCRTDADPRMQQLAARLKPPK